MWKRIATAPTAASTFLTCSQNPVSLGSCWPGSAAGTWNATGTPFSGTSGNGASGAGVAGGGADAAAVAGLVCPPRLGLDGIDASPCRRRPRDGRSSGWFGPMTARTLRSGNHRPVVGLQTLEALHHGRQEPPQPAAIAAGGPAEGRAEQHAGQFAAAVEDRSARVAVPRRGRQLDHLEGLIPAGRDVLRASAGHGAIRAAAVAGDGERLAGPGRLVRTGGSAATFGRQMANAARSQSRSVRSTSAAERKPSGKKTVIGSGGVADDVPIGHHQAVGLADGHQGAGAQRSARRGRGRSSGPRPDGRWRRRARAGRCRGARGAGSGRPRPPRRRRKGQVRRAAFTPRPTSFCGEDADRAAMGFVLHDPPQQSRRSLSHSAALGAAFDGFHGPPMRRWAGRL